MSDNTDNSAKAFQELVRVLEEAVRAGAHSVGLEYKGRDLMVFHNFGNTGLGASRIPQELQEDVIAEIVKKRACLSRKAREKCRSVFLARTTRRSWKNTTASGVGLQSHTQGAEKEIGAIMLELSA